MREIFRYSKRDNLPVVPIFTVSPSLRYLEDVMAVPLGPTAAMCEALVWLAQEDQFGR
jgi:hypothetical protein